MRRLVAALVAAAAIFGLAAASPQASSARVVAVQQDCSASGNWRSDWVQETWHGRGAYCLREGLDSYRLWRLIFQGDGNLVLYRSPACQALNHPAVAWQSNTWGRQVAGYPTDWFKGEWLIFQKDGNVVVYNKYWKALWATGQSSYALNSQTHYEFQVGSNISPVYHDEHHFFQAQIAYNDRSFVWDVRKGADVVC